VLRRTPGLPGRFARKRQLERYAELAEQIRQDAGARTATVASLTDASRAARSRETAARAEATNREARLRAAVHVESKARTEQIDRVETQMRRRNCGRCEQLGPGKGVSGGKDRRHVRLFVAEAGEGGENVSAMT
jgi:hypothetical protein